MDALERIVLLEEPFAGDRPEPVHGLPVRVAGDESAHSAQDVARLTREYGYSAIACKPIAKTLSVTLEMVRAPLFCAAPAAAWRTPQNGVYRLDGGFYGESGIFAPLPAYADTLRPV